jgi:hypothetical protein
MIIYLFDFTYIPSGTHSATFSGKRQWVEIFQTKRRCVMGTVDLTADDRKPPIRTPGIQVEKLISLATTNPYRILLAEDDKEMRAMLVHALRNAGYEVTECPDGLGLLTHLEPFLKPEAIGHEGVDLIISDIRMPGFTGMEVLEGGR